jgi:hypothetical protein
MSSELLIVLLVLLLAGVYFLTRGARFYFKLRGKRLITCPENHHTAAVALDARRLARMAILGTPKLELSECSRWPEKAGCGQECLAEINEAGPSCLVRRVVSEWYKGKPCALCGKSVEANEELVGHTPALLTPEKITVYWNSVSAEQLPDVFKTHAPVCWSCHIAESFRRQHPDMIVERPARW